MTENTGLIVIFGQKIGHMIFIYLIIQFWSTDPHSSGIQMVVPYLDHHSNTGGLFKWHSNNGPFGNQTTFDHFNT